MRPAYHRLVKQFLNSPEATASAFSSVGWDVERNHGDHAYWCVVDYGILSEMELDIVLHADGDWFVEMFIPPVLADHERQAEDICRTLSAQYSPLVATVDTDRSVLLGAVGQGDPVPTLQALWQAFGAEDVYQAVLLLCGLSAPTEEDKLGYDVPDDPFEE